MINLDTLDLDANNYKNMDEFGNYILENTSVEPCKIKVMKEKVRKKVENEDRHVWYFIEFFKALENKDMLDAEWLSCKQN